MLGRTHVAHPEETMNGHVEFYDEDSAWGLIRGDDGRLYDLRGAQVIGAPPQVGERLLFEPQAAPGAPRAAAVRRLVPVPAAPRAAAKPGSARPVPPGARPSSS